MKVKNNTNKPIGIGVLNLLPGQTDTLPKAYEKHPIVTMLATKKYDDEHTFITLIKESAESKAEETTDDAEGEKKTYSPSQVKRLGLDKLKEIAAGYGIAVDDATTKEQLVEAIISAQGADNGSEE